MTVNALRHYQDLSDCEIVVIDNSPESSQGNDTKLFVEHCADENIRYIPFSASVGPANAKNEVFNHARGDAVLVIDSHVLLNKDAIAKLKAFYADYPNTNGLYQGPRYMDDLKDEHAATHFEPVWSSGMLGQWRTAWKKDYQFWQSSNDGERLRLSKLDGSESFSPGVPWCNHEPWLVANGYTLAISSSDPFEIKSQGMGLFSCRREAWLGFNPNFREFGGEEGYIHDKFHKAGRLTWCLPWLGWQHRDRKSDTAEYPARTEAMFRNYVLGHRENEKPLDALIEHYSTIISKDAIDRILANPEAYTPQPIEQDAAKVVAEPSTPRNRNELFNWCLQQKGHKLNGHGAYLSKFASKFKHVTEISSDHESSIYLLAGDPDVLRSYQEDHDYKIDNLREMLGKEKNNRKTISWTLSLGNVGDMPSIDKTEALFLNSRHTYERMKMELEQYAHKVEYAIVIAKSIRFGEKGEDGGKGIGKAVYEFIKENPNWFIVRHDPQQEGMTTISCVQSMRPPEPIFPWNKGCGPGTELKKLFADLGIVSSPTCSCNARARAMDHYGIEWCEENVDKIVGWLKEEHEKQSKARTSSGIVQKIVNALPFSEIVARKAVTTSIERAKAVRDSGGCPE